LAWLVLLFIDDGWTLWVVPGQIILNPIGLAYFNYLATPLATPSLAGFSNSFNDAAVSIPTHTSSFNFRPKAEILIKLALVK
jgi:hypothetical protein